MPLLWKKRRALALLVALSLSAAACASEAESTSPTLATATDDASSEADDDAAPDDSAGDEVVLPGPIDGDGEESEDDAAEAPIENLFPDIDVLNIADGSTVNLATELGGGDKATLLWFFAPH